MDQPDNSDGTMTNCMGPNNMAMEEIHATLSGCKGQDVHLYVKKNAISIKKIY